MPEPCHRARTSEALNATAPSAKRGGVTRAPFPGTVLPLAAIIPDVILASRDGFAEISLADHTTEK
jgi:hypothetical protein